MSWSVNAHGKAKHLKEELATQFAGPLGYLSDEGERETVRLASEMIAQCIGTFDPERIAGIEAYGHMGFQDWDAKTGAYQSIKISIIQGPWEEPSR